MGDRSAVDVHSLEDFHATLAARLDEANATLTTLVGKLQGAAPQLGGFSDATGTADGYLGRCDEQVTRARRLVEAVSATQTATGTIIDNYTTTEARNAANARDIANTMRPVGEALDGGEHDA